MIQQIMTQELPQSQTDDDSRRKDVPGSPCVFVQKNLCKACGLCITFCPKKVLSKGFGISEMGYEFTVYAGEGCTGCGTCFYVCPEPGAITVVKR